HDRARLQFQLERSGLAPSHLRLAARILLRRLPLRRSLPRLLPLRRGLPWLLPLRRGLPWLLPLRRSLPRLLAARLDLPGLLAARLDLPGLLARRDDLRPPSVVGTIRVLRTGATSLTLVVVPLVAVVTAVAV